VNFPENEAASLRKDRHSPVRFTDHRSGQAEKTECQIKQQMTTHWDLDFLSREELEAEMARGAGRRAHGAPPAQPDRPGAAGGNRAAGNGEDTDNVDNPVRAGIMLLGVAIAMMVVAVMLLRSGGV